MIENYKTLYKQLYSKVKLESVLKYYKISFKTYHRGKKGKEFLSCCPFHDDSTPSFAISQNTGLYNCFVCGGGDFIKFIKTLENLKTTKDAIEFIKVQVGITETIDIFSVIKSSENTFVCESKEEEVECDEELKEINLPVSEPAEKYFEIVKKRVEIEDIKKYGMKYCVNDKTYHDRLIIPVYMSQKLITFAARDFSGKSDTWSKVKAILKQKNLSKIEKEKITEKYMYKKILYPFGTPMAKIFFNWDEAIKNHKEVVICEGIFDAIRIIKYGYNGLALLSCHLNSFKAKMLMQNFETIYIALDNDDKIDSKGKKSNPGQESAQKMIKEFLTDAQVYNLVLPFGKDPDDCSKEEFDKAFYDAKNMQNIFTLQLH